MAFVNLSLLFGGLLVGVPILLHLMMRQQPKHLLFPAVRFLKKRRESNKRTLQLRHWILLLLRCGVLGGAALMLARPSTSSSNFGHWLTVGLAGLLAGVAVLLAVIAVVQRRGRLLTGILLAFAVLTVMAVIGTLIPALGQRPMAMIGDREAPVAAVVVVDSAPRMGYTHENQSRIEVAKELARDILRQLPDDSEIAVLDSRPGATAFAVDESAAFKSIDRLTSTGAAGPLSQALGDAVRLVSSSNKTRKEIYVLTDLSEGAWEATSGSLRSDLESHRDVSLVIVDVGIPSPINFAIRSLELSSEMVARGGEVVLRADVAHVGPGGNRTLELRLDDLDPTRPVLQDGKLVLPATQVRGQQTLVFERDGVQQVEFRLRGLEQGVHHGALKLIGEDGLSFDDVRYFTVEVKAAWPILVVAPTGVLTEFFVESIAPYEWAQQGRALFDCEVVAQANLANKALAEYAAVALIDPSPLTPADWQQLERYVTSGGGLAVFLGSHAHPVTSFNEPLAQSLLGAKLAREWRTTINDLSLAPERFEHPVLRGFRNQTVPWNQLPVYRHWVLEPLESDTRVLIPFSNRKPALIERSVGKGRVVVMATPVSEPVEPAGRTAWNELFTSEDAWPSVVLLDQIARFVVSSGESKLNYRAGETAILGHHPDREPDRYQLFSPNAEPQDVTARDQRLTVRFTEDPGTYRLKGFRGSTIARGFSVNVPTASSNLTRLTNAQLDEMLGPERYQLARSREEINREIGEARVGREFYSYLLLGLVVILAIEQLLSNRFYRRESVAATDTRSATSDPLGQGTVSGA
ncbi:MAG: hypothetical protein RIS70_4158 [Planctomycetota bacterium]